MSNWLEGVRPLNQQGDRRRQQELSEICGKGADVEGSAIAKGRLSGSLLRNRGGAAGSAGLHPVNDEVVTV